MSEKTAYVTKYGDIVTHGDYGYETNIYIKNDRLNVNRFLGAPFFFVLGIVLFGASWEVIPGVPEFVTVMVFFMSIASFIYALYLSFSDEKRMTTGMEKISISVGYRHSGFNSSDLKKCADLLSNDETREDFLIVARAVSEDAISREKFKETVINMYQVHGSNTNQNNVNEVMNKYRDQAQIYFELTYNNQESSGSTYWDEVARNLNDSK